MVVEPHRHAGVFIARGKEDALVTKNMVMGESVYGEKRIATEDEAGKVRNTGWAAILATSTFGKQIFVKPNTRCPKLFQVSDFFTLKKIWQSPI